jgi:hypothetical protein
VVDLPRKKWKVQLLVPSLQLLYDLDRHRQVEVAIHRDVEGGMPLLAPRHSTVVHQTQEEEDDLMRSDDNILSMRKPWKARVWTTKMTTLILYYECLLS